MVLRDGEEVTLHCENHEDGCDRINWLFDDLSNKPVVQLIERGQIGQNAWTKSNRLDVTEECSLVIENVTVGDAGRYTCRHSTRETDYVRYHLSFIRRECLRDNNITSKCLVKTI